LEVHHMTSASIIGTSINNRCSNEDRHSYVTTGTAATAIVQAMDIGHERVEAYSHLMPLNRFIPNTPAKKWASHSINHS